MKKNWYVVYTRSRCEKKVASLLLKYGVEHFCPLNRVLKQWADRKKIVHEPLFKGYVFVKIPNHEHSRILQLTTEIINFVYWLGKPAIIKDHEIENISNFLNNYTNVKLEKQHIQIDKTVRILNGALMDKEGIVTSVSNNKVKIILPSLGYTMVAETHIANVQVIDNNFQSSRMVS